MADYFTNFSLIINLASEAEQAYALELANKVHLAKQEEEELPDDFPPDLREALDDWFFETALDTSGTKHGLWLHSIDGGVDAVCAFIRHLLQKFQPQGRVTFE
jgi:hypothetical protein